jgi:hypothetical protein
MCEDLLGGTPRQRRPPTGGGEGLREIRADGDGPPDPLWTPTTAGYAVLLGASRMRFSWCRFCCMPRSKSRVAIPSSRAIGPECPAVLMRPWRVRRVAEPFGSSV